MPTKLFDDTPSLSIGRKNPWMRLAAGVVKQALKDFHEDDPVKRVDALLFLISPDAPWFLNTLGFNADPLKWLRTGAKMPKRGKE